MRLWHILKLLFHVIRGIITPTNLKHSVRAGSVLCESGVFATTVKKIQAMPDGEKFFRDMNLEFNHGRAFFEKFPEGSLGRCYFNHLKKYDLDPSAFPIVKVHDEATYIEHVVRHAHDIWHVLLGFDVSINAELGLQAFKAKQFNWPFAMVGIGGGSFVTLFKTPSEIENLMDQIARGSLMGASCAPIITIDWNLHWNESLTSIRAKLGLGSFFETDLKQHNITYQQANYAYEPDAGPA